MTGINLSTIAFISIACLFIVLFLGCVGLSLFLCLQMKTKNDEDKRNQAEIDKLKKKLIKRFKENVKQLQNLRPKTASNKVSSITIRPTTAVGEKSCTICLDRYSEEDTKTDDVMIGVLRHCGHYYHFECIWAWLGQETVDPSCPVCRKDVSFTENDIAVYSWTQIIRDPSILQEDQQCDITEVTSVDSLKIPDETSVELEAVVETSVPEPAAPRSSHGLRSVRLFRTVTSGQAVVTPGGNDSELDESPDPNFVGTPIFPPV